MSSGKNLLPLILIGLLFVSATLSAICVVVYVRGTAELRGLQGRAGAIENNRNLARLLAGEAMEYGKKDPAINSVLQPFGLNANPAAATTPKSTK